MSPFVTLAIASDELKGVSCDRNCPQVVRKHRLNSFFTFPCGLVVTEVFSSCGDFPVGGFYPGGLSGEGLCPAQLMSPTHATIGRRRRKILTNCG